MHSHDVSFTLYGIKNCDTMKKARLWLDQRQLSYHFHDYRVDGVSLETLQRFLINTTWQALLNTRCSTWRKFSEEERRQATNANGALQLMVRQPSVIKRPVLERQDGALLVGFDPLEYEIFFSKEA